MLTNAITQPEDLTSHPTSALDRDPPGFTSRLRGDAVLACEGELDQGTNPSLRRSLDRVLRLEPDRVVVDLSRVSFFDAGAISELVRARTTSRAAGHDLVVRWPSSFGRRVLGIVGLSDLVAHDPRRLGREATLAEPTVELADRFTAGNRSSVVIDEARGLIAEHFDVGISEASIMLQAFSTDQRQSMRGAAAALMARTVDVALLAPHRLGSATPRCGADQDAADRAPSAGS